MPNQCRFPQFPDLTVDGSFPLGGAVVATLILQGVNPAIATFIACLAGALAGLVTAWLNVQLKILHLLASILTMIRTLFIIHGSGKNLSTDYFDQAGA